MQLAQNVLTSLIKYNKIVFFFNLVSFFRRGVIKGDDQKTID